MSDGKLATIEQVLKAADGETLDGKRGFPIGITGRLEALYERKCNKPEEEKAWSLQNGLLSQGSEKVKIVFKDRDEVPQSWKGKHIVCLSRETQNGVHGVKCKDDTYKGKTTRVVWVTPAAEVTQAGSAEGAEAPRRDPPRQDPPPQDPPPRQESPRDARPPEQRAAAETDEKKNALKTGHRLVQYANLMNRCWDAALKVGEEHGVDVKTPDGRREVEAIRACFFIQATRENLTDIQPTKLVSKKGGNP